MGFHQRLITQKDSAEAKDYRVLLGFRPTRVRLISRPKSTAVVTTIENYDGNELAAAGAGGWKVAGGNAPDGLTAAQGIRIEDTGVVLGSDAAIRLDEGRLILQAWEADTTDTADLGSDTTPDPLSADGGFGTGKQFEVPASVPSAPWIGPTS